MFRDDGKFIAFNYGKRTRFDRSILLNKGQLEAGDYIVYVDPCFNKVAKMNDEHRKLLISIYSKDEFEVKEISESEGKP